MHEFGHLAPLLSAEARLLAKADAGRGRRSPGDANGSRECAPDDRLRIVRRAPGEGDSPRVELAERAPHPNPLPANSGERENRSAAAAPPTQPNIVASTCKPPRYCCHRGR